MELWMENLWGGERKHYFGNVDRWELVWLVLYTSPHHSCTCSLPTLHIYCTSNRRHNWNLVEHLHHELFCRIVNMVSPLAIFVEELHCVSLTGCLTGFLMGPCPITYYSWKKVLGEALHYWSYTRESWTLGHQ